MDATGAKICDELPHPETRDIVLPNQTGSVSQIAVDIGGSLAKVVYFSKRPNTSKGGRLNFVKFETEKVDDCIDFIGNLVAARRDPDSDLERKVVIKATGGGAHKFYDAFTRKLKQVKVEKEDEMECLITGLNFLIVEIPYEVFTYSEHDPMHFEDTSNPANMFPYMIVNIGSGVSILKVTGPDKFERISGTSLGGGTLWGLLSLLTGAKSFDEMLELSKCGDNTNVDMLVGDIYGTDYNKIGLKATTIASSMGKVFKKNVKQDVGNFRSEDISKSLLFMVSNNIGQIAYLNAQAHGLKRIYFGGCFIRGHPITMNTLSYAINYWSRGTMKALFLRHEGYLGAVGAFLKHTRKQRYSFSENFTAPQRITETSINAYGILESTTTKLVPFPKLENLDKYNPDTLQLTDATTQKAWIDVLEKNLHCLVELATERAPNLGNGQDDTQRRASSFDTLYRGHLASLREQPNLYGALTVRSLLNLREQCLHEMGFSDIFAKVKEEENKSALLGLQDILKKVDSLQSVKDKLELLIDNMLAGNMFDWGSSHVLEMLKNGELSFEKAKEKIKRPDHFNHTKQFIERITSKDKPRIKKAVIFVDNSGADVVLGVIPFARFLLSLGTDVILAANSFPAVNDITYEELLGVIKSVANMDHLIAAAFASTKLSVLGTGSTSLCLDLRRINEDLANACQDINLVVLEGMGRAIHTNYNARFTCESLKMAVIKNVVTAIELNAHIYDSIVLYEEGSNNNNNNNNNNTSSITDSSC